MSEAWPRRRAAVALFLAASAIYLASPVRELTDSTYSLLAAQTLATRGTLDLAPSFAGELETQRFPGWRRDGLPYQVRRADGKVLYDFPLGAVLLAVPWMAAADAAGLGVLDAGGRYDFARERRHQAVLAALLSALFVAAAFAAADRLLPRRAALALAAAFALSTPLWSTASRGLWSHTACLALLGLALPLVAARADGDRGGALRLGLLAAAAWVARPTAAIAGALLLVEVVARDRRDLRAPARFLLGALLVLVPFALLSAATWGELLPPYYRGAGMGAPRLDALAGALSSPNRGLFVFEPALAVALAYGVARRRALGGQRAVLLGAAGLALQALLVASFPHWWGGHSYGPRLFTETLFLQAWIAIPVAAALVARGELDRQWRRAFGAALLLGAMIHAGGALSKQGYQWNSRPVEVDLRPERVWEWRDWQPLAWANRAPRRAPAAAEPQAPAGPGIDVVPGTQELQPPSKRRRGGGRERKRAGRGDDG